jgi:arylsulfatase A-like enzyme
MPFVLRYLAEVAAGSVNDDIVLNVDFAPLFLDLAGVPVPAEMQGRSFRPLLHGETPADWQQALYYRYWEHRGHNVYAHYGIRTLRYKLIYYYSDGMGLPGSSDQACEPEWELFDLEQDPSEMRSVCDDPAYAGVRKDLTDELHALQARLGDERYAKGTD